MLPACRIFSLHVARVLRSLPNVHVLTHTNTNTNLPPPPLLNLLALLLLLPLNFAFFETTVMQVKCKVCKTRLGRAGEFEFRGNDPTST